jgi:proteasome regulatory subunit
MNISPEVSLDTLVELTDGVSGADLKAICTEAGMFAIREERDQISLNDFMDAIDKIMGKNKTSQLDDNGGVMFG